MLFSDTFSVGGGGSPRTPLTRDPVGAVVRQLDRVHPQRRIGIGVPRARDLVEQLRGDGVDRHRAAGSGMFGDDRGPVGVDLGDREPGVSGRQIGQLTVKKE